jgi:hypothetical protein
MEKKVGGQKTKSASGENNDAHLKTRLVRAAEHLLCTPNEFRPLNKQ